MWTGDILLSSEEGRFRHPLPTPTVDTTSPRVQEHRLDLPVGGEGKFNSFALIISRRIAPLDEALPAVYDIARREAVVPLLRTVWGIPCLTGLVVFAQSGEVTRYAWDVAQQRRRGCPAGGVISAVQRRRAPVIGRSPRSTKSDRYAGTPRSTLARARLA